MVDAIKLDVTSKATLTGLDQSLEKLKALKTALDGIHARLAGLSAGPGVKRTKAEIEELLKAGTNVKTLPVSGVAKALGLDVDKFEAHVRRWKQANKELAKTALAGTAGAEAMAATMTAALFNGLEGK